MHLIDYTNPEMVPNMYLAHSRRSKDYYLRLDQLPKGHPYYYLDWALFRHAEWLEGGSAWVQAKFIVEDMERYIEDNNLTGEVRPVIGSGDFGFDEGIAQGIISFGYRPLVAELSLAEGVEDIPFEEGSIND